MKYIGITAPAWSLQQRKYPLTIEDYNLQKDFNCGPGSHSLEKYHFKFQNAPKWTFKEPVQKLELPQRQENDDISQKHSKDDISPSNQYHELFQNKNKLKTNMGQAPKFQNFEKRFVPGPGSYDIPSEFQNDIQRQSQFSSREYGGIPEQNRILGPGKYDPINSNWDKGRQVYFEKIPKPNLKQNQSQKADKKDSNHLKEKLKIRKVTRNKSTFAVSKREQPINNFCQGEFTCDVEQLQKTRKQNFSWSFGQKFAELKANHQQEPSAKQYLYSNKDLRRDIGYQFQKSERFKKLKSDIVNFRAQENQNTTRGPRGYSFGSQSQRTFLKSNGVPGPGQYKPPSSIKTDRERIKTNFLIGFEKENFINPGPGNYNQNNNPFMNKKGIWKFGIKFKSDVKKLPTDSMYNVRFKMGTKGYQFGDENRFKKKKKEQMGPGYYDLKQTIPQIQPWVEKQLNGILQIIINKCHHLQMDLIKLDDKSNESLSTQGFNEMSDEELMKCEESLFKAFGWQDEFTILEKQFLQSKQNKKVDLLIPPISQQSEEIQSPLFSQMVDNLNYQQETDDLYQEQEFEQSIRPQKIFLHSNESSNQMYKDSFPKTNKTRLSESQFQIREQEFQNNQNDDQCKEVLNQNFSNLGQVMETLSNMKIKENGKCSDKQKINFQNESQQYADQDQGTECKDFTITINVEELSPDSSPTLPQTDSRFRIQEEKIQEKPIIQSQEESQQETKEPHQITQSPLLLSNISQQNVFNLSENYKEKDTIIKLYETDIITSDKSFIDMSQKILLCLLWLIFLLLLVKIKEQNVNQLNFQIYPPFIKLILNNDEFQ